MTDVQQPKSPGPTLSTILENFTQTTTTHSLSKQASGVSTKRKLFWALLFVASLGYLIFQLISSANLYMSYPVRVVQNWHISNKMEFPAVTICNLNALRKSALQDYGFYDALEKVMQTFCIFVLNDFLCSFLTDLWKEFFFPRCDNMLMRAVCQFEKHWFAKNRINNAQQRFSFISIHADTKVCFLRRICWFYVQFTVRLIPARGPLAYVLSVFLQLMYTLRFCKCEAWNFSVFAFSYFQSCYGKS